MTLRQPLSVREDEVARLIGQGLAYHAVARELGIAERTVRQYVERIASKLPPAAGDITPYKRVYLWAATHLLGA